MNALPLSLFGLIRHFVARHRVSFTCIMLISFMWSFEQVAFPYVIKLIIDIFSQHDVSDPALAEAFVWPLALGGSVWIVSVMMWRLADVADYFFSPNFQADIRTSMTQYVFGHSHRYFTEHLAGSVANKIADMVHATHYLITQSIRFFIPSLMTVFLTAGMMWTINPLFSVVIFVWAIVHLLICGLLSRRCDTVAQTHSELRSDLQGRIVDSISNFVTVRLFARKFFEMDYIRQFQKQEIAAHRHVIFTIGWVRLLLELPAMIMIVTLMWLLIHGWKAGWVGTGDAAFILTTTFNLIYLLWRVGMEFPAFYREIGVGQQALSLIIEPYEVVDAPNATLLKVTHGEIRFDNVTFNYHPGQDLFEQKNITIAAGEKVGLVGFSGSGKSTFVNLILRLYDLDDGRILIDGQDIALATQDSLRSAIAMIPQEPTLFHRSLMDNIRYGRPDATDEEVIEAAKQSHCHDFILQMPEGYASLVGERGVKLSGGQRQRIAIARAILKNAPILILDEATSSLDSATEQLIQRQLKHWMLGRTTIVVAHRLSTLTNMDRILVFQDGAVMEDGSHETLLAAKGRYATLWEKQIGGFLPEDAADIA